jgi:hypothetical protein
MDAVVKVSVEPLTKEEIRKVVVEHTGFVGGRHAEFFYHRQPLDEPGSWEWILIFYLKHHFRVSVRNAAKKVSLENAARERFVTRDVTRVTLRSC